MMASGQPTTLPGGAPLLSMAPPLQPGNSVAFGVQGQLASSGTETGQPSLLGQTTQGTTAPPTGDITPPTLQQSAPALLTRLREILVQILQQGQMQSAQGVGGIFQSALGEQHQFTLQATTTGALQGTATPGSSAMAGQPMALISLQPPLSLPSGQRLAAIALPLQEGGTPTMFSEQGQPLQATMDDLMAWLLPLTTTLSAPPVQDPNAQTAAAQGLDPTMATPQMTQFGAHGGTSMPTDMPISGGDGTAMPITEGMSTMPSVGTSSMGGSDIATNMTGKGVTPSDVSTGVSTPATPSELSAAPPPMSGIANTMVPAVTQAAVPPVTIPVQAADPMATTRFGDRSNPLGLPPRTSTSSPLNIPRIAPSTTPTLPPPLPSALASPATPGSPSTPSTPSVPNTAVLVPPPPAQNATAPFAPNQAPTTAPPNSATPSAPSPAAPVATAQTWEADVDGLPTTFVRPPEETEDLYTGKHPRSGAELFLTTRQGANGNPEPVFLSSQTPDEFDKQQQQRPAEERDQYLQAVRNESGRLTAGWLKPEEHLGFNWFWLNRHIPFTDSNRLDRYLTAARNGQPISAEMERHVDRMVQNRNFRGAQVKDYLEAFRRLGKLSVYSQEVTSRPESRHVPGSLKTFARSVQEFNPNRQGKNVEEGLRDLASLASVGDKVLQDTATRAPKVEKARLNFSSRPARPNAASNTPASSTDAANPQSRVPSFDRSSGSSSAAAPSRQQLASQVLARFRPASS